MKFVLITNYGKYFFFYYFKVQAFIRLFNISEELTCKNVKNVIYIIRSVDDPLLTVKNKIF